MSKKPKAGTVGAALETTIIFPPKTLVEELAKAKRDTKKRTQSANGTLGEKIGAAVEDKHLDRKAFSIACQLDALAVDVEDEAIVGADANRVGCGNGREAEAATEVKHQGLTQRRCGMGDPCSLPFPVWRVGLEAGLGLKGKGRQKKCSEGQN